jgi:hypothetical protein
MSRHPNFIPSYRLHKQSGQAIVTLRDTGGRRHDVLLGLYGSPESRADSAAFSRALKRLERRGLLIPART